MDSQDIFSEDYEEACNELGSLLNLNIGELNFAELKKIVKKNILSWHPDKNNCNPEKLFLENKLKRLNSAWTIYKIFKQSCDSSSEECDNPETAEKMEDNNNSTDNEKEIDNIKKCINELCRLLGCNITELTYKELSSLVKKRSISLNPKNNINNPRREFLAEQLKELEEIWQLYKNLRPGCSQDKSSDSEGELIDGGEDSYADNTAYSEEFFKISPKKNYEFPDFLKKIFRSESCRRAVMWNLIPAESFFF
ncbi:j domain-containing protein [Caerostris darwini]|uniref:J domain-containing protein n=1 Tax=Caerostris darwini TaxID=1538125 RepID=A0AAV4SE98_9ARAC|nr:j domain-containing protein [Caerostris darwini]